MDRLGGVKAATRYDAFRLLVLALTLVGFVAMHGLASAGGETSHCALPDALISPADTASHHMIGDSDDTAGAHVGPAVHSTVASSGHTGDDGGKSMAGCLLALLGALVALALRLVRLSAGTTTLMPASSVSPRQRAARAPPQPLFLSLCVIRL
jgi:hypothetical protein